MSNEMNGIISLTYSQNQHQSSKKKDAFYQTPNLLKNLQFWLHITTLFINFTNQVTSNHILSYDFVFITCKID